LPPGIRKGQIFNILVRQLRESTYTPIIIQRATLGVNAQLMVQPKAQPQTTGAVLVRTMVGTLAINIVVSTKELLLYPEEGLLAWRLWIQQSEPAQNRWYPVLQRYLAQIIGRVTGFGGNPSQIAPSPTGTVPRPKPPHPEPGKCEPVGREFTGKVIGIKHDRFGDFEGFILLTECQKHCFADVNIRTNG
jgi:hypothetical protein